MSIETKISTFTTNAQAKIGELTYEIHQLRDGGQKNWDKLEAIRWQLNQFLHQLHPYNKVSDANRFITWTEREIEKEIDKLTVLMNSV